MAIEAIMDPAIFVCLIMVIALILFITEVIPISATAVFVCVSLYAAGILTSKEALKDFGSENVMIIAGLGIIGEAAFKTGAAAKIGILLKKVAKTERAFVFWLTLLSGIVSGFLSNNGAAALLISLTLGICTSAKLRRSKVMYPITVGAIMGGGMTTVGSNSTLYLKEVLEGLGNGQTMTFFELTPICLILVFVGAVYLATIGFNLLPEAPRNTYAESEEEDYSNVPKWKPALSVAVLIGTVIAMYFEKEIGISVGFTAMIGALIVVCAGLLSEKEAVKAVPLKAIVLYAAMVPVSTAITNSGAGDLLSGFAQSVLGTSSSAIVVLIFIFLIIIPITNCMSNSVTIIMFCPVALAVAQALGMDPKATLIAVRLAGTIGIATPIAWPGAAMALEPGGYKFMDYVKVGIPLSVIMTVVSLAYLYIAYPLWA